MRSQLNNLAFWVGGVLVVILVTIFYQPTVAKTGSLLVWLDGKIYVMDIDTLALTFVGSADASQSVTPSPGCLGQMTASCWVVVGDRLYTVGGREDITRKTIPLEEGAHWPDAAVSWSPDGIHLAYSVIKTPHHLTELRLYNALTAETKIIAAVVDPTIPIAWTVGCAQGLETAVCQLGYKIITPKPVEIITPSPAEDNNWLVALTPLNGEQRIWLISEGPIFELGWTADNTLLYSRPKHYFYRVEDGAPAYHILPGSQLANLSPHGRYTVYYEAFTQKECQAERPWGGCWYLGVWLANADKGKIEQRLIHSLDLSQVKANQLSFDPVWTPQAEAFVFAQAGQLIYYEVKRQEAVVWSSSLQGQLVSPPVFSPHGGAVALAVQPESNSSEYRLLVINPQLKPIEHHLNAQKGFRVLAWLPHQPN